jgi:hypothetical protein
VPMAPLDTLHRRRHGSDAILFAFDLIELDGDRMAPGIDLKPAAATAPPCSGKPARWACRELCRKRHASLNQLAWKISTRKPPQRGEKLP